MKRRRTGKVIPHVEIAIPPKRHKGMQKGELARLREEVAGQDRMIVGLSRQIEHNGTVHAEVVTKWKARARLWRRLFYTLVGAPGTQPEDDHEVDSETVSIVTGPTGHES